MGGEVKKVKTCREHPAIVCRCEDVTLEEIEKAIEAGCNNVQCIKTMLRLSMGPCQGRTCIPLIVRILARKLGKKPEDLYVPTPRPPLVPLQAELFCR